MNVDWILREQQSNIFIFDCYYCYLTYRLNVLKKFPCQKSRTLTKHSRKQNNFFTAQKQFIDTIQNYAVSQNFNFDHLFEFINKTKNDFNLIQRNIGEFISLLKIRATKKFLENRF